MAFSPTGHRLPFAILGRPAGAKSPNASSFTEHYGHSPCSAVSGLKMALISGEPSPLVDRYAEKMHNSLRGGKATRDQGPLHLRELRYKVRPFPLKQNLFLRGTMSTILPAMEIAGPLCLPQAKRSR